VKSNKHQGLMPRCLFRLCQTPKHFNEHRTIGWSGYWLQNPLTVYKGEKLNFSWKIVTNNKHTEGLFSQCEVTVQLYFMIIWSAPNDHI